MPAEDQENLQKIAQYEQEFARYNAFKRRVFRSFFKYYHRLEVIGREHIPTGPALIAANHGGGLDLDILALAYTAIPGRTVQVLIVENWHFLTSRWGKYWVGSGIPLWMKGGIRWQYLDPYLAPGGARSRAPVAIFPEGHSGTFRRRKVLHKFFPGVARIALHYRVPIVPAAMVGFHQACPIVGEIHRDPGPNDVLSPLFTFPVKLKIEFGKPFELSEYYGMTLSRSEEFWIANQIVRPQVAELLTKHQPTQIEPPDVEMKKPATRNPEL